MRHAPVASRRYALLSTTCPFAGAVTTAFTAASAGSAASDGPLKSTTYCCSSSAQLGVAAADARLHDPRARRTLFLLHSLPVQSIREVERLARCGRVARHPVRDDVVVGLVGSVQLHELDAARCPRAGRLDPRARPQLVARFAVFVVAELAVALHQAEAAQAIASRTTWSASAAD